MKRIYAFIKAVVGSFIANNCQIHAAGLTYLTIMAALPMICCILIVAKACNVDEYAKRFINGRIDAFVVNIETGQDNEFARYQVLNSIDIEQRKAVAANLASQLRKVSNNMFKRVNDIDLGSLGWIGLAFLLWMSVSALSTVETSFNQIWEVKNSRPLWKRFCLYVFMMVVMPVFAGMVMSFPALHVAKCVIERTMGFSSLTRWASDGLIMLLDSRFFGYAFTILMVAIAQGFMLWMMPNCKLRFRNALLGGLVTGLLLAAWMKLCTIAQVGIARSSMLYGSFSLLPIVLAWSYMSWQIVLLGANFVKVIETGSWKGELK